MIKFILPFLLLLSAQAYADIFKGVGDGGEVLYSDRSADGGESVKLKGYSTYQPPKRQQRLDFSKKSESGTSPFVYKTINIRQPANDATLFDSDGPVNVVVTLDPMLRKSDLIQVYLDGHKVGKPLNTTVFSLKLEDRGTHDVRVAVQNQDGHELGNSDPVQFHLRKHSVLFKKKP